MLIMLANTSCAHLQLRWMATPVPLFELVPASWCVIDKVEKALPCIEDDDIEIEKAR
jgi:hypothetical protein